MTKTFVYRPRYSTVEEISGVLWTPRRPLPDLTMLQVRLASDSSVIARWESRIDAMRPFCVYVRGAGSGVVACERFSDVYDTMAAITAAVEAHYTPRQREGCSLTWQDLPWCA